MKLKAETAKDENKHDELRELLVDELRDMYSAERQLLKSLPKLAKEACSDELVAAFNHHLEETRNHVIRLEKAFDFLEMKPRSKKCEAMEGLISEGKELLGESWAEPVMDAGIICAAQKVEHYEIASYGTIVAWAKLAGYPQIANLLFKSLEEEKAADKKLTELAESIINENALGPVGSTNH